MLQVSTVPWGRMGEEGGAGGGERESGSERQERTLEYTLVTTAANDEAALGPRRGCNALAWQPARNGR